MNMLGILLSLIILLQLSLIDFQSYLFQLNLLLLITILTIPVNYFHSLTFVLFKLLTMLLSYIYIYMVLLLLLKNLSHFIISINYYLFISTDQLLFLFNLYVLLTKSVFSNSKYTGNLLKYKNFARISKKCQIKNVKELSTRKSHGYFIKKFLEYTINQKVL